MNNTTKIHQNPVLGHIEHAKTCLFELFFAQNICITEKLLNFACCINKLCGLTVFVFRMVQKVQVWEK